MGDPDETRDEPLKPPGDSPLPEVTDLLRPLAERFDLLAELGRGGMGIVYKARDRETGDVVALKILRPEIAARADLIERFKSELRLARKITHKNVCRVYDLDRFGPVAAISMEYIEGESLRGLLGRVEGLSVRHGLKILRQILAGLGEAHAQGVVHRDLKPENILIARDGTVKVMDFGIARSVEAEATATAALTGTPAYMSPEQAQGKPADERSDIYSLGLVMYEMFTGQRAFEAQTPVALAMKQVQETPPAPRSVEPDLPDRIDRAIERCVEKDPKKRFQSVADLEAAFSERPTPAATPEGEPVPAPHLSRWQGLDTALLVLGVVGMIYFLAVRDRVFPVAHMRLKVDAIGARRAVEDLAARLGRPIPETLEAETKLGFRGYWYAEAVLFWLFGNRSQQPLRSLAPAKPLVVWQLKFGRLRADTVERTAVVDSRGKMERLQMSGWIPGNYQPRPVEERRALARQAAELACGTLPQEFAVKETMGGEQGASYTAAWKPRTPPDSPAAAEVSLLAEKVVDIQCKPREQGQIPSLTGLLWFPGTLTSTVLVMLFVLGGCYRLSWRRKRLPLGVVLGAVAVWLLSESLFTSTLGLAMALLMGGIAATIGLVTAEYFLRRREPERVASYVLVWRGRFAEPAVALAILRGALAGLALAAFETLLAHVNTLVGISPSRAPLWLTMFSFVVVDPEPVGQALESFSPPLFAAGAALLNGVVIALIFLGLPRALLWDWLSRRAYRRRLGWLSFLWLLTGLHLHLAEFLTLPAAGKALAFFLEALLLVWLLERYDVLTTIAAVATAVLWMLNYPLLLIFREVGNTGHWVVFLAWGAVVLLAAVLGFRSALGCARQRLVAQFR